MLEKELKTTITLSTEELEKLVIKEYNISKDSVVFIEDITYSVPLGTFDTQEVFAGVKATITEKIKEQ